MAERTRWWQSGMILLILLAGVGFLAFANIQTFSRDADLREEISNLEKQKQGLTKKQLESVELLSYVMSDQYIEDSARTALRMKKPDEHMAVIEGEERVVVQEHEVPGEAPRQRLANPLQWWYYFVHHRPSSL